MRFWLKMLVTVAVLAATGTGSCCGQLLSNAREKTVEIQGDTLVMDTLSVVPGSVKVYRNGMLTDSACYGLDYANGLLLAGGEEPCRVRAGDTLHIVYRVFPVSFTAMRSHRERSVIEKKYSGFYNPATYGRGEENRNLFRLEGLSKSGSIARGVSFGNSQDVMVNSSLNLQMAGRLNDDVEIVAAITDNNIPVQPEGNTQQLNDFDKVFIQLTKDKSRLIAGDFELARPESYFMSFNKKAQGGVFTTEFGLGSGPDTLRRMKLGVSGALSKGKYARQVFNGTEGNQGPYKLRGSENEPFIVILSGTEKIYIDGRLLTRGQEYDYIMDYNTAELTFTTRQPITKDKRIVAEFQYSDKSYARSLIYLNDEYESKKLKVRLHVYSEQDSKSQPLLQDLTDDQKKLLAGLGDSLQNAFTVNADSVAYSADEILYELRDTTTTGGVTYSIFSYSTDSTRAHYRVGFIQRGSNLGNYVAVSSNTNGRVYKWVEPVNGIPQGLYEPVKLLIAPRQQQMVTAGMEYRLSERGKFFAEGAASHYNANLFSKIDKANDAGFAGMAGLSHNFLLSEIKDGWQLETTLRGEHAGKNFVAVENYRSTEFVRDWNLSGISSAADENAGSLQASFLKPNRKQAIHYALKAITREKYYRGIQNALNGQVHWASFTLNFDNSYLVTSGSLSKTGFMRNRADLSKLSFRKIITGAKLEREENKLYKPATDSLTAASFEFRKGGVYIANADSLKLKYRVDVSRRQDYGVRDASFSKATVADEIIGMLDWNKSAVTRLAFMAHYRHLETKDTLLSNLNSDNTLLTRTEYQSVFLRGLFQTQTFYETGSGQEPKREYAYVKVSDGTGVFTWNDYNKDGIPQLNEFETAVFRDQANYIRVTIPTNEFVKTRFNRLNQVINLNPVAASRRKTTAGKWVSRFANQFALRIENKSTVENLAASLNPFEVNVDDDELISTNSNYRNTVFFNRTASRIGMDLTVDETRIKTLLTNGIETRTISRLNSNVRWNVSGNFSINQFGEKGSKTSRSDFFSLRDYDLRFYTAETRFVYQPGSSWRLTLLYEFKEKKNRLAGGAGEKSLQHKGGTEMRLSTVKQGILSVQINILKLDLNADDTSPLAYEMLEGLKKGINATWNVSLQRNLSGNVQLSLNYDGRKSEDVSPVHTGSVELRAFF